MSKRDKKKHAKTDHVNKYADGHKGKGKDKGKEK
jgi:hypothetical protein